jgi:hypothetical protein
LLGENNGKAKADPYGMTILEGGVEDRRSSLL